MKLKRKTIKKLLSYLSLLVISIGLLTACGNRQEGTSSADAAKSGESNQSAQEVSIGVLIWSTDDGLGADSKKALDSVAEDLGINLIYRTGSYDPEGQTTDIENLIAAGADGIMCCVMSDTSTDDLLKVCEDAEIPMQVFFRNIMDEEAYNYCMGSEWFAGYICEDEGGAGVAMVEELIARGCTTFGLMNGEAGNGVIDRRQAGVMNYLDEKGITYYVSVNGNSSTASEWVDTSDQLLAAHPDIDALMLSVGSNGIIDAMVTNLEGTEIRMTCYDTPVDIPGSFEAGNLVMLTTGTQIDPVYALINLYCKISGQPKSDTPTEYTSKYIYMKSAQDAAAYAECFSDFNTYTSEEVKALVEMDLDAFVKEMDNYSLEMVSNKMK